MCGKLPHFALLTVNCITYIEMTVKNVLNSKTTFFEKLFQTVIFHTFRDQKGEIFGVFVAGKVTKRQPRS